MHHGVACLDSYYISVEQDAAGLGQRGCAMDILTGRNSTRFELFAGCGLIPQKLS